MNNIAVWGYGVYGKRMINIVETYWSDEIRITKIYDQKIAGMEGADPRIASPDFLEEDFRNGLFNAVMIAVVWNVEQMLDRLKASEIPIFTLGKPEDYYPGDVFARIEDPKMSISQDGYDYYVFKNLRGAVSLAPSTGIMYLFDENGRVLRDHWRLRQSMAYHTHQYDLPLRIDRPLPDVSTMAGDWCILAKHWFGNYWHFTFEGMDCVQLLEEAGYTGKYVINNVPFDRELLLLYGIDKNRIMTLNDFDLGKAYSFERVHYLNLDRHTRARSAPVIKRLSEHIKARLTFDRERYPSRLFVERTGSRKLLNAQVFTERYGFTTIQPEKLTVLEQMEYFYNADIVLCPHGANSTNSIYMREGAVFIETFGSKWLNYCCSNALRQTGVFYLPVVEEPAYPNVVKKTDQVSDYKIQEDNLDSAIDMAIFLRTAVESGIGK